MLLNTEIQQVNAEKIRPLRHLELRKGEKFSTTSYAKDYDQETFHMAVFQQGKVITCATFYPEFSENVFSENPYRLRGMATHNHHKRKGYASALMHVSFNELTMRDCDMIWCNARLIAVDFYKSIGFKIYGDLFDIKGIGPHYYMYKKL